MDGRKRPQLKHPGGRTPRMVSTYLSPEDYRLFYELVMRKGLSGHETLRQLIREAAEREGIHEDRR